MIALDFLSLNILQGVRGTQSPPLAQDTARAKAER